MGEFFELQEAGILDAMGEYIGDEGHLYSTEVNPAHNRNQKVRHLMKQRGITTPKAQKSALKEYGVEVKTDRPTYHACGNWKIFKEFINKRVGYVAPSKKAKSDASTN